MYYEIVILNAVLRERVIKSTTNTYPRERPNQFDMNRLDIHNDENTGNNQLRRLRPRRGDHKERLSTRHRKGRAEIESEYTKPPPIQKEAVNHRTGKTRAAMMKQEIDKLTVALQSTVFVLNARTPSFDVRVLGVFFHLAPPGAFSSKTSRSFSCNTGEKTSSVTSVPGFTSNLFFPSSSATRAAFPCLSRVSFGHCKQALAITARLQLTWAVPIRCMLEPSIESTKNDAIMEVTDAPFCFRSLMH